MLAIGDGLKLYSQTINAWTNPTSAPWQYGTNWSLGVSPAAGQSIYITNQGWKAVGIEYGYCTELSANDGRLLDFCMGRFHFI